MGQYTRPWLSECTGAFYGSDNSSTNSFDPAQGPAYSKFHYLHFDASRVSSIYSNNTNTLNPDSIKTLLVIRY